MFNKVLIANRGAIAVRILRTLKRMGVHSVAVYAEADAAAPHVHMADETYSLGEGPATDTYLNQEKILTVLQQSGAQAVHPGYGFLSENADFCRRVEALGIAFIGPTPEQMTAFGLKHEARALAQRSAVPMCPGTGLLDTVQEASTEAQRIGYPVMLKSTAGGGGIGMQICQDETQLERAWQSVKRLGENNFGHAGIFVEKYIEFARHIEVQVFGDGDGRALVLGDRDCSAQRRHQKVVEEAPAPNIPDAVRTQLHQVARTLVESVQYRNAGTVEFIYDQHSEAFFFLEMNCRLQVEHGVTEEVFGVDLVDWMISLAAGSLPALGELEASLMPRGHAVQARLYAENPAKGFQPSAGQLNAVQWPQANTAGLRIDHWIESGLSVSALFDPMLAKIIAWGESREQALAKLRKALAEMVVEGIVTNQHYLMQVLDSEPFVSGTMYTRYLQSFDFRPQTIDVIAPGTLTTIQDYPGRTGLWDVGVPPSGPFDAWAFRLGNRLLGNEQTAAGLEITLNGPTLRFNCPTSVVVTGASMAATLDGEPVAFYQVMTVAAGQTLKIGQAQDTGARAYLCFAGGLQCQPYLGSRSTFTLGQFGGQTGQALRTGDVLNLVDSSTTAGAALPPALIPQHSHQWRVHVVYGPHGAPDFFTEQDMAMFFSTQWKVHYNSSRTGVRLVGPKPQWARTDGGEAGLHPSNIHDNAYAIGSIDFTGDMPVILGPDGPSLGGFVCPATVVTADLWKLGQLRAGDTLEFVPIAQSDAVAKLAWQESILQSLEPLPELDYREYRESPILHESVSGKQKVSVVYRAAGDQNLLVEYGPQQLNIAMRFRVHALMLWLQSQKHQDSALAGALRELTPGIRSLQVHFDPQRLPREALVELLRRAEAELDDLDQLEVDSRIVHLPLSWDDEHCRIAVQKYMQSVRKDAPWCPDNIEFIRRINGLSSVEDVKEILFSARYLVMGLGDVYLGAPVATPMDPRHRLVTTKYNPARTWTAENSVGIGGSYLCVYGMEGPGGYQFVGRTLQMWNRYRTTSEFERPWLLRFFDQIQFYQVSAEELKKIRKDFPRGQYPLKIEHTQLRLADYLQFLQDHEADIAQFTQKRSAAFNAELERWIASGQLHFEHAEEESLAESEAQLGEGFAAVESPVAGNIWQVKVAPGDHIAEGQLVCLVESMKMEIEVLAPSAGRVDKVVREPGQSVTPGQAIVILASQ